MSRSLIGLLIFLSLLFVLSGCARAPREPGTLRLTAAGDPSTLDPANSYDTTSINFVRVLYRGLVDYDEQARITGAVAKSYTVSPDGLIYRFKLRPDVRFHSGRRVVAEDFRYALERVLDPATASDGLALYKMIDGADEFSKDRAKPIGQRKIKHVRGIKIISDDEIEFHLVKPDLTFLNWLALPFAYAVPREHVEKLIEAGKTLSENPNGCGPFRFVSWVHDKELILQKNPDYYDTSLPKCDKINVQIGIDATLELMQFELGNIDIVTEIPEPDFERLTRSSKWQPYIQHAPMMDVRYFCMNTELKPFDNKLVRQAMNYAINRKRIATFRNNRVTIAKGVLPPGMPGYNPDLPAYPHDPKKAKELLSKAGYENGFTLQLWVSTTEPWYPKAAQSIKQDLRDIGITVNIKQVTYPELKTVAGKRRTIQASLIGWYQDFPDPSNFLDVLLNGKNITNNASNNRAFYSNPLVNKLLDDAALELNRAKRLQMYQQAEKIIMDDAPWAPLFHSERYVMNQPWITGYELHPAWTARWEYVGVGS